MMGSSPVGEDGVYSLLKLISDPNGAAQRLSDLKAQADANAESYRAQKKELEELKAQADIAIEKAAAAEKQAAANLAEANARLEANTVTSAKLDARQKRLQEQEAQLQARDAALRAAELDQQERFAAREKAIEKGEDLNKKATSHIEAQQQELNKRAADLDERYAKLKALIG